MKNIVSLGIGCGVAIYLEKLEMRQEAYPFDYIWCQNLKNLNHILSDDFKIFLDKSYYIKINQDDPNRIHHKYYNNLEDNFNALFAHHNIFDEKVYKSFERRIERFYGLKNKNNIFITFIIDYDNNSNSIINEYYNTVSIMKNKGFNDSQFILVIISKGDKSFLKLIEENNMHKIYVFTYKNTYGCGLFEGEDDEIISDFFKKLL
ncbi:papain-like protein [Moumouvirus australiensis]|uniref:Papain-like cysteine peptidase n=1 Tax=Moumouvirus australiensis TaxID=2109587 RepID=A0A2P1ELU5_9VIRU|nr:papain-like protein [Moumouvirus australiensis]AVL94850.1 papain-like protein [Moumouvirus australiensis]